LNYGAASGKIAGEKAFGAKKRADCRGVNAVWPSEQLSATGGSSFGRANAFPLLAEAYLVEQMQFRCWRKLVWSSKCLSATSGSPFGRVNGFPLPAENNLVE
jgi:hypothetical protein